MINTTMMIQTMGKSNILSLRRRRRPILITPFSDYRHWGPSHLAAQHPVPIDVLQYTSSSGRRNGNPIPIEKQGSKNQEPPISSWGVPGA